MLVLPISQITIATSSQYQNVFCSAMSYWVFFGSVFHVSLLWSFWEVGTVNFDHPILPIDFLVRGSGGKFQSGFLDIEIKERRQIGAKHRCGGQRANAIEGIKASTRGILLYFQRRV